MIDYHLAATPLLGFIYLGAIGSSFWLDLAYRIVVPMSLLFLLILLFG
jgi:hypothetical protein